MKELLSYITGITKTRKPVTSKGKAKNIKISTDNLFDWKVFVKIFIGLCLPK